MIISNLDPTLRLQNFLNLFSKDSITNLESKIKKYFNANEVFLLDSGRSSLAAGLLAMSKSQVGKDEVLVSSYTCVVVINAILKAGLKPVYVDINSTNLGLDLDSITQKISSKTLAIIVQHTFGICDNIAEIVKISKQYEFYLIEDFAHTLAIKNITGDMAFLSFGSNKVISCSRGGALVLNNESLLVNLVSHYNSLEYFRNLDLFKHIFKSICFYLCYPVYSVGGKYILAVLYKLGLFPTVISDAEKNGVLDQMQIYKLHPVLASFAIVSWDNLQSNLEHRNKVSKLYLKSLDEKILLKNYTSIPILFFPILVQNPKQLVAKLKKFRIVPSTEWSYSNIVPLNANHNLLQYSPESCPNAENLAKQVICLPTHTRLSFKKAKKIINSINQLIK